MNEPPEQNKAETDPTMMEKDVEDHSVQDNTTEISKGVATPIPILGAPELEIELSVDEVLERYVGSLGRSQVLQVLLVSLAWMLDAQNTLVTIFTDNNTSGAPLCSHGLPLEASRESVGGHKSSIIAEWGLVCDRNYLAAIPASLLFLGSLLGSAFFGKLADGVLGRKRTAAVSSLLCSATAFATSVSPNIWVYSFLRFANGFARSGIGICSLVLLTEAVGRKWRGQVGQYCFFFYTLGFLSLPLMAYLTRTNWRSLYKIISILPLAYTLLLLPFVSESPRWLLVRGRDSEAIDVLKRYARLNGKTLPANVTLSKPMTVDERGSSDEKLWSTKWAAKRMVLVMIASFGIGFVYYGIQLNVQNLNFNLYVTVALNAVMEIPAIFIGSLLMCFLNRRVIFCLFAAIAGAACILCIIFSHGRGGWRDKDRKVAGGSWAQLSVESVGFMAACTAFDVLLIYSVELFPTSVRNFAVSHLRQAVMLGASLAPPLVALGRINPPVSFLILGVVSILSGVSTMCLPETRNAPLYETLKQQEEEEKKVTGQGHRADSSGLPDA